MEKLSKELDRVIEVATSESTKKERLIRRYMSEDGMPVFCYEGRYIDIKSDGTGAGTHVLIDGNEIKNILRLSLNVDAGKIVKVWMELHDV